VAAGERKSGTNPDTYTEADTNANADSTTSNADTNAQAHSYTYTDANSTTDGRSELAAEHHICRRRSGDVQRRRVSLPTGPHIVSWLGAAECSRALAAGQWNSGTDANPDTGSNSYANSRAAASDWAAFVCALH
jgi:hypothetical protein